MQEYAWFFITLGTIAAVLTSISWLPQVYKGFKTKKLDDLSWAMLSIFTTGTLCWLLYGVFRHDWLIIGANSFIAVCLFTLLSIKAIYRNKKAE